MALSDEIAAEDSSALTSAKAEAGLLPWLSHSTAVLFAIVGVTLVAFMDYATGTELRIYPLYFAPISLAARKSSRVSALLVACLAAFGWLVSNHLAASTPPNLAIELWNFVAQAAAFLLVGYLLANLSGALHRERTLSRTDALTGLDNSRAFYEQASRALSACHRHDRAITIAYIDVDNFKRVNDSLGHEGGDEVLRNVAHTLASTIRGQDLAARMGGDEFVVLLPETDSEGAHAFLGRLRDALAQGQVDDQITVTLSIGAVVFLQAPEVVEKLLHESDRLMYAAKAAGKDRFHIETFSKL